jgi:heme/copper-type cytochrome/quinol oxidase subunit 2
MESAMKRINKKLDLILLALLVTILVGLPFGIQAYDRGVKQEKVPPGAKDFTLTGNAQRGWIRGEVHAYEALCLWGKKRTVERPVLEVSKGDLVVLGLRSSDVVHGFSLKEFGVFVSDGIQPGKTVIVSFRADKAGSFTFSCNAICGDNHQNMQGTLVVKS